MDEYSVESVATRILVIIEGATIDESGEGYYPLIEVEGDKKK